MTDDSGVLGRVRTAAALRVLFVPHAIKAMARLAVITAYVPDPAQWTLDFRRRTP